MLKQISAIVTEYKQIFSYLKDFSALSEKTIRNFERYEDYLLFNEIQDVDKNFCIIWENAEKNDTEWIKLFKPAEPKFPDPPLAIAKWIDEKTLKNIPDGPILYETIVEDGQDVTTLSSPLLRFYS